MTEIPALLGGFGRGFRVELFDSLSHTDRWPDETEIKGERFARAPPKAQFSFAEERVKYT